MITYNLYFIVLFTNLIHNPRDEKENNQENIDKFILEFTLNLYEDEIVFNVKQRKEILKLLILFMKKAFYLNFLRAIKFFLRLI